MFIRELKVIKGWRCQSMHYQVDRKEKFCVDCGLPLFEGDDSIETFRCDKCNAELGHVMVMTRQARYCPWCGESRSV